MSYVNRYFNVGSTPSQAKEVKEPQRHFVTPSAFRPKPAQHQAQLRAQRQPCNTMAYALECEQAAQKRFADRLHEAYEHAEKTGIPAEVTTTGDRGNYGPMCY